MSYTHKKKQRYTLTFYTHKTNLSYFKVKIDKRKKLTHTLTTNHKSSPSPHTIFLSANTIVMPMLLYTVHQVH